MQVSLVIIFKKFYEFKKYIDLILIAYIFSSIYKEEEAISTTTSTTIDDIGK